MTTQRKRRIVHLFVIGLILLAVVPGVILITLVWQGHARFNRVVAQAEARGLATSVAQWRARHVDGPAAREHAAALLSALRLLKPTTVESEVPYVSNASAPALGEAISPTLSETLDTYMTERAAALAAITAATAPNTFDFADEYNDDDHFAMELWSDWRRGARAYQVACLHAQAHGDTAAATQAILNIAALNHTFDREPFLIGALVRVACDTLMVRATHDMLSRVELTADQLAALRSAFDQRVASTDAPGVIASELAQVLDRIASMPAIVKRSFAHDAADVLDLHGRFKANRDDWAQLFQALPSRDGQEGLLMTGVLGGADAMFKGQTILALGQNMLALEQYRIERQAWPQRIEDVPHAVRDPLTGDWPAYRLTDTGCVLASEAFPSDETFTFHLYSPDQR